MNRMPDLLPQVLFQADPESPFRRRPEGFQQDGLPQNLPENGAPLRLGAISFINTIPIYYPFHFGPTVQNLPLDTVLSYAPPSALNQMMLEGLLDVSPVSSAFYLRHQDQFERLSDLSVSSFGSVDSVILLSKLPFGSRLLELESIGVPDSSETSIALLTHLLLEALGETELTPKLQSGWLKVYPAYAHEQALNDYQAILMIGDDALRLVQEEAGKNDYFIYDLATLWQEQTGLPFVFAVWIAQKEWAAKNSAKLEALNGFLVDAQSRFLNTPALLNQGVALAKQQSNLNEMALNKYFTVSLNYQLQPEHIQSLSLFGDIIKQLDQKGFEVSLRNQPNQNACLQTTSDSKSNLSNTLKLSNARPENALLS